MKLNKKYCALIDSDSGYDNQLLADCCVKIAEEFAIGFAEWMRGFRYDNAELYFRSSAKELLEIYKKEKGL
jgi:hypothetical protein